MFVDETARLTANTKGQPLGASEASRGLAHDATPTESIRSIFPREEDVSVAHLIHHFTSSEIGPSMPTAAVLPRLIATGGPDPDSSKVHTSCLHALAASFFGKMTRNKSMYDKGQWLYTDALAQLAHSLASSGQDPDCGTLRAIMCLSLYENINVTEPTAWFKHYDGLSKLILLRGPTRHRNGMDRDLLRTCRFMIILRAGILRVPCFLVQPSWKIIARPSGEEAESSFEVLLDIMAEVPGILHDLDNLRQDGDPTCTTGASSALRHRTQAVLQALHAWKESSQCCALPSDKAHCFALAIHHSIVLCLAEPSRALSLPLLSAAEVELDQTADLSNCGEGTALEPGVAERDLAMDICALAHVILQDGGCTGLAYFLIFPLQKASQHLEHGSSQACWVANIMDTLVADNFGLELGRRRDWIELFAK